MDGRWFSRLFFSAFQECLHACFRYSASVTIVLELIRAYSPYSKVFSVRAVDNHTGCRGLWLHCSVFSQFNTDFIIMQGVVGHKYKALVG